MDFNFKRLSSFSLEVFTKKVNHIYNLKNIKTDDETLAKTYHI